MRQVALIGFALLLVTSTISADPPPQAATAFSRAQLAIAGHDCDAAIRYLAEAVAIAPDYWEAHRSLGECFLTLNQPDQARPHLEESLRLNPSDAATQSTLRRALELEKAHAADDALAGQLRHKSAAARPAPPSGRQPRPLGDFARTRPSPGAKAESYVLTGSPGETQSAALVQEEQAAPKSTLDSMRDRAASIFRPRMAAIAPAVRDLMAARRRYRDACWRKTTTTTTEGQVTGYAETSGRILDRSGGFEIGRYTSETNWTGRMTSLTTLANEETPTCRAIASDIRSLAPRVAGAMDGADTELASPPSVYPGIREEVFARLAAELW
jgi:tetratricopeptide repeat protein